MQTCSAFGYRFFKRLTYNLFILLFMLILRENIIKLILRIISLTLMQKDLRIF